MTATDDASNFAIEQPGVIRFLEENLGSSGDDDALSAGLALAIRLVALRGEESGQTVPRLLPKQLSAGLESSRNQASDSELEAWIETQVGTLRVALSRYDSRRLYATLAALAAAIADIQPTTAN